MAAVDTMTPHAIMLPRPLAPGLNPNFDPHAYIKRTFGPILKATRIHTFAQSTQYFVGTHPDDTLIFPALSPLYPEERYHWFVAAENAKGPFLPGREVQSYLEEPGTVKFGYLRDPEAIPQPSLDAKAEYDRRHLDYVLEMRKRCLRFTELVEQQAKAGLDADEEHELAALRAELT